MHFWKYQGAGNDFILVDQRAEQWINPADMQTIARLCDRHFGIGADGLILLESHPTYGFEMLYFNADGKESSMCGNGGRCFAAFLKHLNLVSDDCRFLAIDGPHEAKFLLQPGLEADWVSLQMSPVAGVEIWAGKGTSNSPEAYTLNTGSPHYVRFVPSVASLDMVAEGRRIRYSEAFNTQGINVNLVEVRDAHLYIRTYERGVENETLACGTGVTAAALAYTRHSNQPFGYYDIPVKALGGELRVKFQSLPDGSFTDIWLSGPAKRVFSGIIDVKE